MAVEFVDLARIRQNGLIEGFVLQIMGYSHFMVIRASTLHILQLLGASVYRHCRFYDVLGQKIVDFNVHRGGFVLWAFCVLCL